MRRPSKMQVSFLAMLAALSCSAAHAAGTTTAVHVIYKFGPAPDGDIPKGRLVADSAGRLYGTTIRGGRNNGGMVFRLTPPAAGSTTWTEEDLHDFGGEPEGTTPEGPLVLDATGNVYGVTFIGSVHGVGTVWRLDAAANYALTVLHIFADGPKDAAAPEGGVIFGPGGLLYGATYSGGHNYAGAAFSLSPSGDSVEYAVLHSFSGRDGGGYHPYNALAVDSAGGLIGATAAGGDNGLGTVFRLYQDKKGKWEEATVHEFAGGNDAGPPVSTDPLVVDASDEIFGCGVQGGTHGQGGIFTITPQGSESVLYNFGDQAGDPNAGGWCSIVQDGQTILGTTPSGGTADQGALFELAPPAQGGAVWTETVLRSFKKGSGYAPLVSPLKLGDWYYATLSSTTRAQGGRVFKFKH